MNFTEFQRHREELRRERPDVVDAGETNLYRALARLAPPAPPEGAGKIHRCHLAEAWADAFGFPAGIAKRALVSCGVRDSLSRLFPHYAGTGTQLWLPADNYPVFDELARAANLLPNAFPTLPEPDWPTAPPTHQAEVLLVTNPLKPLGRHLHGGDVEALRCWLAQSPRRRLLLDSVYTFSMRFHDSTLRLLETGQTLLLHSLTKGWLTPRTFGIALVPEADAAGLAPIFRDSPPSQENLACARDWLTHHSHLPAAIAAELVQARHRMLKRLPAGVPGLMLSDAAGYFVPVAGPWAELLQRAQTLGIPATVFGSPRQDITLLSTLGFVA